VGRAAPPAATPKEEVIPMRLYLVYFIEARWAVARPWDKERHKKVRMFRDEREADRFILQLFRRGDLRFLDLREVEVGQGQFHVIPPPF
jgi:hypothetical protein